MKNYKIILFIILGFIFSNCNLDEEPPFLANENVYSTASDASGALRGIYASFVSYNFYGNDFLFLLNQNSGFGVTRRGGNDNKNIFNVTLCSLTPTANDITLVASWQSIYQTIGRANDAIQSAIVTEDPITNDELVINDVVGQAYFVRAFNYFNLVRMWGDVPLRLIPTTKETIHMGKSSIKEIYAQIISDAMKAQELMNGSVGDATPKPEAAAMLLAKVYMTLATAPASQQEAGLNYWQMAYDEAIKVYGKYALVASYDALFQEETGDETSESIFEIQSSEEASLDHVRAFTPSNYINAATFGWFKVNYEVYDSHANTYPGDPRLATTYVSQYVQQNNGVTLKVYPANASRANFNNGFPYLLKLGERDQSSESRLSNKNFKIYRYADLLLMLAEISNELQNGEQLGYVSEVLNRVGMNPQAGYQGDQESFRNAIMKEYQFELLFEGHDWFNNRRRGYDYFLNNVIIPHNTAPLFKASVDVTMDTNEANVMYMPIPQTEIDTNELISN